MDSAHAQIKHDHSSGENVLNKVQDCISSYSPSDVSKSDNCLDKIQFCVKDSFFHR
jgi:hypothetical protein